MLCNACGAHFLVKKSLYGYMPGHRTSSTTTSGSSQHIHSQNKRHKVHQVQQLQYQTDTDTTGRTASSVTAGSMVEQDFLEVEQPAFVSSRKTSRLVACSVYEVSWPHSGGVLHVTLKAAADTLYRIKGGPCHGAQHLLPAQGMIHHLMNHPATWVVDCVVMPYCLVL
jgi:hypothetical protein